MTIYVNNKEKKFEININKFLMALIYELIMN
jgi:hypothetical protein